jgi:microcystin-dependent protein
MDYYLGEIRMFGFNFAPVGWALCNGQILSIAQNSALFALLGTTYGGTGTTTFGLPNLQGRFPMHWGQSPGLTNRVIGETSGVEATTLNISQMPAHQHSVLPMASSGLATQTSPSGAVLAAGLGSKEARFASESGDVAMAQINSSVVGNNLPMSLMNPYQVVTFCISLGGVFPSRS